MTTNITHGVNTYYVTDGYYPSINQPSYTIATYNIATYNMTVVPWYTNSNVFGSSPSHTYITGGVSINMTTLKSNNQIIDKYAAYDRAMQIIALPNNSNQ